MRSAIKRTRHGGDVLATAAYVKGFGCRPFTDGATRTGAGVRKPPREETAGLDATVVRQTRHGAMGIWTGRRGYADSRAAPDGRCCEHRPWPAMEILSSAVAQAAAIGAREVPLRRCEHERHRGWWRASATHVQFCGEMARAC